MKFLDWFVILLSLWNAKEKLFGKDEVVTGGFRVVDSRWKDVNINYKVNNEQANHIFF